MSNEWHKNYWENDETIYPTQEEEEIAAREAWINRPMLQIVNAEIVDVACLVAMVIAGNATVVTDNCIFFHAMPEDEDSDIDF